MTGWLAPGLAGIAAVWAAAASVSGGPRALDKLPFQLLLLGIAVALGVEAVREWTAATWAARLLRIGAALALVGLAVGHHLGFSGALDIPEGASVDAATLDGLALEVFDGHTARQTLAADRGVDWLNRELAGRIQVVGQYPSARQQEVWRAGPLKGGPVALRVHLKGPFLDEERWLSSADEEPQKVGPVSFQVRTRFETGSEDRIELVAPGGGSTGLAWLERLRQGPVALGELQLTLVRELARASVSADNALVEASSGPANAAVELSVSAGGETEREVLFARVPQFTLHPRGLFGHTLRYVAPGANLPPGDAVQFAVGPEAPDRAVVKLFKEGSEIWSETLAPGEFVALPWAGVHLTLEEVVLNARKANEVVPVTPPPAAGAVSAMGLALAGAPPEEAVWLLEGESTTLTAKGARYDLRLAKASTPLPFPVSLERFTPSTVESELRLGTEAPVVVRAGQPARVGSYAFYQGARIGVPGDHHRSSFQVTRDPGRPLDYLGGALCVLGLLGWAIRPATPEGAT